MIRSMTGYGRALATVDNMEITAEIRSVNHRYFEFNSRIPRQFGFLDDKIKAFVSKFVSRGKVECYISINLLESQTTSVTVNHPLASAYVAALNEIANTYSIENDVSTVDVARFPDVLTIAKAQEDEQAIYEAVISVLKPAIDQFIAMREVEGNKLKTDLLIKCDEILEFLVKIEEQSKETVKAYRARLEEKIRELIENVQVDEQRLLTETAIFADKIATDEEATRLRSHVSQLKSMLESNEAVGKKMDFLIQEFNREANTIGSKCNDVNITKIVIEIKSRIEKIREQIQNIE